MSKNSWGEFGTQKRYVGIVREGKDFKKADGHFELNFEIEKSLNPVILPNESESSLDIRECSFSMVGKSKCRVLKALSEMGLRLPFSHLQLTVATFTHDFPDPYNMFCLFIKILM